MINHRSSVLPSRIVCLVTDVELAGGVAPLLATVGEAARGGVNMIQVRSKKLSDEELIKLAEGSRRVTGAKVLTIVNGSLLAAIGSAADGLHLPEGMPNAASLIAEAHENGLLAGKSVHSEASATQAARDGADYLVAGTVFASSSHSGGPTCGLDGLTGIVRAAGDVPVIGIGGIVAENAASVLRAGASGVAVISAIIGAPDPGCSARRLSAEVANA